MRGPVLPGQTVGILGGGQLGRMLAMVARRSGYRVAVLAQEEDAPASHFAHSIVVVDDGDAAAWADFARQCDVVTLEFENLPLARVAEISQLVPVRPGLPVLRTAQDRAEEKRFLARHGMPLAPFAVIGDAGELAAARDFAGWPAVLKTAGGGYDGKGQAVVPDRDALPAAWERLGRARCTLEQFVDLECEVSVLVARDVAGRIETFGPVRNAHSRHILDVSQYPAGVPEHTGAEAREIARQIAGQLDLVGLVCVEYFVTRGGGVLVNELAPRPHNSGHLTIEACSCSQFEQQLRTVCGLPVAPMRLLRPAAMANLLGDVWEGGEPAWENLAALPDCRLHLYEKQEPRPGRKMGHLTACADRPELAAEMVISARQGLTRRIAAGRPAMADRVET